MREQAYGVNWRSALRASPGRGEIAVGLLCIRLVKRDRDAAGLNSNPETQGPPFPVSAIAAILGVILGAVLASAPSGAAIAMDRDGLLGRRLRLFRLPPWTFSLLAGAAAAALSLSGSPTIGPGPWGLTS